MQRTLMSLFGPKQQQKYCTMVFGGSEIWLKNLENFCTKTCQFIRKKRDKNGPQLICIVLQYHIVQKVDLSEKIDGLVCLFGQILSNLAAFLIANCDFWLENTWLTFLKRFMTENWPKQKKSKKVSTRDRTGDLLCGSQN